MTGHHNEHAVNLHIHRVFIFPWGIFPLFQNPSHMYSSANLPVDISCFDCFRNGIADSILLYFYTVVNNNLLVYI